MLAQLFCVFFLVGCFSDPRIDTTSTESYFESIENVRNSLTYDQKVLFNNAAKGLVLNHKTNGELTFMNLETSSLFASPETSEVLPYYTEIFDGMNAQQVIESDKALSDNLGKEYIRLDTLPNLVISFEEDRDRFPDDKEVEWRGKIFKVGELRAWAKNMNENAELTLNALRLNK